MAASTPRGYRDIAERSAPNPDSFPMSSVGVFSPAHTVVAVAHATYSADRVLRSRLSFISFGGSQQQQQLFQGRYIERETPTDQTPSLAQVSTVTLPSKVVPNAVMAIVKLKQKRNVNTI